MRRLLTRLAATSAGTAVTRRVLPPIDRLVHRVSGGRVTLAQVLAPTLVLESTGAKSGQRRENPLVFSRDGDAFVVVGTNWGQSHHPAWTANVLTNPDVVVHVEGRALQMRAVPVVDDAERARLWPGMDAAYAGYARYREVIADRREIRMFRLVPR